MSLLRAESLSHNFGSQLVLNEISFSIGVGDRVGVIGPNGSGKSTLLHVLAGLVLPDAGRMTASPSSLRIGYLPQEPEADEDETLIEFFARRTGVAEAEGEVERLASGLADDPSLAGEHSDALESWTAAGGVDLAARAAQVCRELAIDPDALNRRCGALSGGNAARTGLALLLLTRFDVYLLDEPTNSLDFPALERLERFVTSLAGAAVIVSHDRAFLERTTNRILAIDGHTHQAAVYSCGWSAYESQRQNERRQHREAYERFTTERSRLLNRQRERRQWAASGERRAKRDLSEPDKTLRRKRAENAQNLAADSRVVERKLGQLEEVAKPWQPWELQLSFAVTGRRGDVVMQLEQAVARRGAFTLGPIDLELRWQERLAVTGRNGVGKSTLLQAMLGAVPLESGRRYLGPAIRVGELEQDRSGLHGGSSLLEQFCTAAAVGVEEARSLLAKFGLGADHVLRSADSLSAGERTRAALAKLVAQQVNCLILDEPTNHLDLEAIEQLELALQQYDGTLVLVTHDRRLLANVKVTQRLEL